MIQTKTIIAGSAEGEVIAASQPLSFWGGTDPETGVVIDPHHELKGQCLSGKILVMPEGRGSCSGSAILLEMTRLGTEPKAILALSIEPILAMGSVLARELYGKCIPMAEIREEERLLLKTGRRISLKETGELAIMSDNL